MSEILSVKWQTSALVSRIEGDLAKFRSPAFTQAASAANTVAAKAVQEGMRKELANNIGEFSPYGVRQQRPGKRLEKAITNARNRHVTRAGFEVGIEDWLNESPAALYWRRIEEGDPHTFTGKIMFSNNAAGGGYGRVSGPFTRPSASAGDMRMPQFAYGSRMGVVVNDIGPFPALNYSAGGEVALAKLDMADLYERYFRDAGFSVSKSAKGGIII